MFFSPPNHIYKMTCIIFSMGSHLFSSFISLPSNRCFSNSRHERKNTSEMKSWLRSLFCFSYKNDSNAIVIRQSNCMKIYLIHYFLWKSETNAVAERILFYILLLNCIIASGIHGKSSHNYWICIFVEIMSRYIWWEIWRVIEYLELLFSCELS